MIDFNDLPAKDKIYYQDDAAVIYCADNREILPLFPDKAFDLVLTDPPYGVELGDMGTGQEKERGQQKYEDFADTPEYLKSVVIPSFTANKDAKSTGASSIDFSFNNSSFIYNILLLLFYFHFHLFQLQ